MRALILDHRPGCSPTQPCTSCQVLTHLRNSMTSEAMEKYEALLSEATEVLPDPNAKELLLSTLIGNLEGTYTPTATLNKLRAIGITTFGDLVNHSEAELKEKGLSNYMITGLRGMLERRGFTFKA